MSLPATIQTSVGQSLLGKITRLYNNSLFDILVEALQNSRRAGASRIDIDVVEWAGRSTLVICDDGSGIDDPAKLVTLGDSGWDDSIAHREDPAGMGVFSLAGRHVEVRSYARAAASGWSVDIPPEAWEAGMPLVIEPCDIVAGTELRIEMPDAWLGELYSAAAKAARYYPLPVHLRGEELARRAFLAECGRIEEWQGCRIGVFSDPNHHSATQPQINFHGLTVLCPMPCVAEIDGGGRWRVKIDIVDAPALQLVLPARKEMVCNAALDALREAAERAIFNTIAEIGSHRLPHEQWLRARELGVDLPEAESWLVAWLPRTADSGGTSEVTRVASVPMILVPDCEPEIEQCAARALVMENPFSAALVREDRQLEGYAWYDNLPQLSSLAFRIEANGRLLHYDEGQHLPDEVESGRASSISLDLVVAPTRCAASGAQTHTIPCDVLIAAGDSWAGDLRDTVILLATGSTITPGELASLIEDACFCARDDCDDDSWDTQHSYFVMVARQTANALLLGPDAAVIERIRDVFADEIGWLIPEGRRISMLAGRGSVELAFIEDEAVGPPQ
jgi:hypothetical protein